jgi:hypothetical protein
METSEVIDGKETLHRCWIPTASVDWEGDGYLIFWDSLYTYLDDIEIHLWTTEEDTQFFRLALKGTHLGDRYLDFGKLMHDEPREFLLWTEIADVNKPVDILPPEASASQITIPFHQSGVQDAETAFADFPLPEDATLVSDEYSRYEIEVYAWLKPREYFLDQYYLSSNLIVSVVGPRWQSSPDNQFVSYKTGMGMIDALQFYVDQAQEYGWGLEDIVFRLSESSSRAYLVFARGGISTLILLTGEPESEVEIFALLPPSDETIRALLSGWSTFTQMNSGLTSDEVSDIEFDAEGRVWIASSQNIMGGYTAISSEGTVEIPIVTGGLSIYDWEGWTGLTTENSNIPSDDLEAVAYDASGYVWVASRDGVHMFDGEVWRTYTSESLDLGNMIDDLAIDDLGRVWVAAWDGLAMYDGIQWRTYKLVHSIKSLALDQSNRPVVGTTGGGLYLLEAGDWVEISPSDTGAHGWADTVGIGVDDQDRIWTNSRRDGLRMYDGSQWVQILPDEKVPHIPVPGVFTIDPDNRVWIVLYSGGVLMLDENGTWHDYTPLTSDLSPTAPNVIQVGSNGSVWIGTTTGVRVFEPPQ